MLSPEPPDACRRGQEYEIFHKYYGRVLRFFRNRGLDEDKARELTQETFLHVFSQIHNLRVAESLDAWILRIAANEWKNAIRHQKTKKRDGSEVCIEDTSVTRSAELALLKNGNTPSPQDEALASERLAVVARCFDALPLRMRRCLVLHVFHERKYEEIGEILKISIQGVRSHIHKARQHLKECVYRRLGREGR